MHSWGETTEYLFVDFTLTVCRKKRNRSLLNWERYKGRDFTIYERNMLDKYATYLALGMKKTDVTIKASDSEIIL